MILGMKVGPQRSSFEDLVRADPPFVEVWFNISRSSEYETLFSELKKRKCQVGLHYWGALPDGTWTNFAYPDATLITETVKLMKETVDIAAKNGFSYVNIHPGSRAKVAIDFNEESFRLLSAPVEKTVSENLFLEHAARLFHYAKDKGVVLTIETVPPRVTKGWRGKSGRSKSFNIYELSTDVLLRYAERGFLIANDFCHTAASLISDSADEIRTFLVNTTKKLAPATRLIHLGFIIPPYNGTDYHGMLDAPEFSTELAVPNKQLMIELLKLFQNRTDVWVIAEPESDHPKNYSIVKELAERTSK